MTNKEINEFKTSVVTSIDSGRIVDAISRMRALAPVVCDYNIMSALDAAEEHYRYMLRHFPEGASDQTRRDNYDDLRPDLRMGADRGVRKLQCGGRSTLYYNKVRTRALHPERGIADAAAEYAVLAAETAGSFDVEGLDGDADRGRRRLVELSRELFDGLWTTFPLDKADADAVSNLLGPDSSAPHGVRMRLIAATGMGMLEFYDPRRVGLLAEVLDTASDEREAISATAGLLLSLFRYRQRTLPRSVRSRLAAAAEHPLWRRRVGDVYVEMLRSRDTERVVRQVREEMMPDIMKLGKDIMDSNDAADAASAELNPEWEEKLRESGMYDRMREFSEMTASGADIFMGAFSHLKNFPFFSDIDVWFAPFDESEPRVAEALGGEMASFVDMLVKMPVPCDNDKYSILLSLEATPLQQREQMGRQLEMQRAAMEQAGPAAEGYTDQGAARSYVQNLYRFFKLYGRRNEFFDPFGHKIFLLDSPALHDVMRNPDTLAPAAELLFKIEAWDDALKCFNALISISEPTPELYQKAGYCCEQSGRIEEAAENYSYADLMDGTSAWTLRRLGAVLRRSGRPERAVEVLSRLVRMQPDAVSPMLNLAYACIEAGDYAAALTKLHELEARGESGARLVRALAWCSYMAGDYDSAREYYRAVLSDNPDSQDYLNMGHLAWSEGRIADAVEMYGRSMASGGYDVGTLEQNIRADVAALAAHGVDVSDLPLILDATAI